MRMEYHFLNLEKLTSAIQAVCNVCAPEPHLVPDNFQSNLTRQFTFMSVVSVLLNPRIDVFVARA
jgi:hypothetical protein